MVLQEESSKEDRTGEVSWELDWDNAPHGARNVVLSDGDEDILNYQARATCSIRHVSPPWI
jgi:hypothetical protein